MPTDDTIRSFPTSGLRALSDTELKQAITSQQNYSNSIAPSSGLSMRWLTPESVQEFASQVNAVATKVLNGEIDSSQARTYATLARVVAQALAVEVMRARLSKTPANLRLSGDNGDPRQ